MNIKAEPMNRLDELWRVMVDEIQIGNGNKTVCIALAEELKADHVKASQVKESMREYQ